MAKNNRLPGRTGHPK